jgi:hypothetical protein
MVLTLLRLQRGRLSDGPSCLMVFRACVGTSRAQFGAPGFEPGTSFSQSRRIQPTTTFGRTSEGNRASVPEFSDINAHFVGKKHFPKHTPASRNCSSGHSKGSERKLCSLGRTNRLESECAANIGRYAGCGGSHHFSHVAFEQLCFSNGGRTAACAHSNRRRANNPRNLCVISALPHHPCVIG